MLDLFTHLVTLLVGAGTLAALTHVFRTPKAQPIPPSLERLRWLTEMHKITEKDYRRTDLKPVELLWRRLEWYEAALKALKTQLREAGHSDEEVEKAS